MPRTCNGDSAGPLLLPVAGRAPVDGPPARGDKCARVRSDSDSGARRAGRWRRRQSMNWPESIGRKQDKDKTIRGQSSTFAVSAPSSSSSLFASLALFAGRPNGAPSTRIRDAKEAFSSAALRAGQSYKTLIDWRARKRKETRGTSFAMGVTRTRRALGERVERALTCIGVGRTRARRRGAALRRLRRACRKI